MKSKNFKVEPGFEDIFSFSDKEEKIEHRAQMISYRILSEIEKICEERDIKMKDLAKMIDTSASYVTQLFRGYKQVNTALMAKFEEAADMVFDFSVRPEKEQHDEHFRNQLTMDTFRKLKIINPGHNYYCVEPKGNVAKMDQLLEKMEKEEKHKQTA
jgi:transcriptional regulator with XRE-family HTH domain